MVCHLAANLERVRVFLCLVALSMPCFSGRAGPRATLWCRFQRWPEDALEAVAYKFLKEVCQLGQACVYECCPVSNLCCLQKSVGLLDQYPRCLLHGCHQVGSQVSPLQLSSLPALELRHD